MGVTPMRRYSIRCIACALAASLLGGCSMREQTTSMAPESPPETLARTLLPVAPPPMRPPDADWLRGLSPMDVQNRMGEADFVRMEPGAHVMQYRSAVCSLDIIFLADHATSGALRAGYLVARQGTGVPIRVNRCLMSLVSPARWPLAS